MAETLAQLETRLANVRASIERVLQVQSYSISGRQVSHANLKELRQLEKDLMRRINRLNNGAFVISDFSQADADNVSGRF